MVIAVEAHKIAYMAVPKAGCTTVKAALARIDPTVTIPPEDEINVNTWHAIYPTRRFRPFRWEQYEDYWRFCVVRDPAKRLMSCYTNRVVHFRELHNSRKLRRPQFAHLSKDPDPDFFFQHLKEYMTASSVIKHHALGIDLFIGPLPLKYDRVYRTEEMDQLGKDLSQRTGQAVEMKRENSSDMKLDVMDLKPETRDSLRERLDKQYAHLSDYYQNPL